LYLDVMIHYVYIIYSASRDVYYRGYSLNPDARLVEHNNQRSSYTRNKGPWSLVYKQSFDSKREALLREKMLKKYSKQQILQLVLSSKNEL